MAQETPDVISMIAYEDGFAALDWFFKAFGFKEITRMAGPDGKLAHGEMEAGNGLIMLATPTPDYESLKHHRTNCESTKKWSSVPWVVDGVLVHVDDVDKHFAQAKRAGAHILSEPEPGPTARRYRVEDLEGHCWMLMGKE